MSRPVKSTDLINWKTGFYLLLLLQGLAVLSTFTAYGITNDEPIHALYGTYLVRWYTSLFQDGTLFELKNLYLYGGLFETLAQLAVRLSPLDPYETRHLCNSLVGLVGVVAAYRIGSALGTPATGFLAALCLVLTPIYYGHSFNNPKDIPFAVAYLWTLYYMVQGLSTLPHLPSNQIWKTGLAMGLTLSIRIGGLVLAPYWVLFYGFRYLQLMGLKPDFQLARRFLRQSLAVFAIAYGTMFLFWPLAQVDPIHGPLQALNTFSQFPETHYSFFQGDYIISNTVP